MTKVSRPKSRRTKCRGDKTSSRQNAAIKKSNSSVKEHNEIPEQTFSLDFLNAILRG